MNENVSIATKLVNRFAEYFPNDNLAEYLESVMTQEQITAFNRYWANKFVADILADEKKH